MVKLFALAVLALVMAASAQSQQIGPTPPGCLRDLSGNVGCPPLGGEVHMTLSGQVVCGKGRCVRDVFGKITCAAAPGGAVTQDATGNVACAGGCEEASAVACLVPR